VERGWELSSSGLSYPRFKIPRTEYLSTVIDTDFGALCAICFGALRDATAHHFNGG
jgi:hypothetical protein